jgi:hypothetical protein
MESYVPRRYGHCDSYFVESDEISLAERLREQRRQVINMRQADLARELSNVTADEYLEEVLDHMEYMEVCTRPGGWAKADRAGNHHA